MNASSVNATTFRLQDQLGNLVAAQVTVGGATPSATLTPSSQLAASTTYTATIVGGSGGVKDLAGNALASNVVWSFTTCAALLCPWSIWSPSAAPSTSAASDSSAVELGVRFRADQSGLVSGIRFYKATTNAGPHIGSLWTNSGTLLASATFANET